jgi:hypothetical protein
MTNVEYKGGRNGAIGPDYFQIDVRAGWRRKDQHHQGARALPRHLQHHGSRELRQPVTANSDRRLPTTFLVLTNLRGGGGFPRQAMMGQGLCSNDRVRRSSQLSALGSRRRRKLMADS